MSKEAYQRERFRIRQEVRDRSRIAELNRAYHGRLEQFPWEADRALEIAKRMGRESSRINYAEGIEAYLK